MPNDKSGQIVWHDLFTDDRQRTMNFFQRVAGWNYETERATDFAWGGGEKDFVLAMSGKEAGAGFAETPPRMNNGWIAYVEVPDVDATAAHAEKLGGAIVRQPFEVPGVGRNALLRDPLGALIGISLSRHDFPVPRRQFGVEIYITDDSAFPEDFYSQLFNWKMDRQHRGAQIGGVIIGPSGRKVALHVSGAVPDNTQAIWTPSIKVTDLRKSARTAKALDASFLEGSAKEPVADHSVFICDPGSAFAFLSRADAEDS